jgi:transcriptional regulator with XRE-family HTH domain
MVNLTEFGAAVRKARIDSKVTLQEMAGALGVTPAYLSGLEVGRKRISTEWAKKIEAYFRSKGVEVPNLRMLADVANKSVSLEGMSDQQAVLLAGFARTNLTKQQIIKFSKLLQESEKEKK